MFAEINSLTMIQLPKFVFLNSTKNAVPNHKVVHKERVIHNKLKLI